MKDQITRVLRIRKVLIGRDFYQSRQVRRPRMKYGKRFTDWTFCPQFLDSDSVVYSFGVGEDLSFDLQLIENFQLKIDAFDPSPRSIEWVKRQDLPGGIRFHPYGVAGSDGELTFTEPAEPGAHSLRIISPDQQPEAGLNRHVLPVFRLPTIQRKLGHRKIDLLKMDIEGAEYEVIQDIVSSPQPITQVLVEFHHRFPHFGIEKTKQAISMMNKAGYMIFHVSPSGEEISFIKNGA
jgi:FkbM family methyltransferase